MKSGKMPAGAPKPTIAAARTTSTKPGVKNMAPGTYKGAPQRAPHSKGNVKYPTQGGSTSPKTDAGGGVGNTTGDLQRYLGRK